MPAQTAPAPVMAPPPTGSALMKPSEMAAKGLISFKPAPDTAPKPKVAPRPAQQATTPAQKPSERQVVAPKAEPVPSDPIQVSERLAKLASRERHIYETQQAAKAEAARVAADRQRWETEKAQHQRDLDDLRQARELAKTDPYSVMETLGTDFKKLSEQYLKKGQITEEQRKLQQLEKRLEEQDKRNAEFEKQQEQQKKTEGANAEVARFKRDVRAAVSPDAHRYVIAKAAVKGVSVADYLLGKLEQINRTGQIDKIAHLPYRTLLDRLEKSVQYEATKLGSLNAPAPEPEVEVAPPKPAPKRRQTMTNDRARVSQSVVAPKGETFEQRKARIMKQKFGGNGGYGF